MKTRRQIIRGPYLALDGPDRLSLLRQQPDKNGFDARTTIILLSIPTSTEQGEADFGIKRLSSMSLGRRFLIPNIDIQKYYRKEKGHLK
jgi:hypothetical protein